MTKRDRFLTLWLAGLLPLLGLLLWYQLAPIWHRAADDRLLMHPSPRLSPPIEPTTVGNGSTSFVDRATQAGLHYRWHLPNTNVMDNLDTIGNGCGFLDHNNDGNLDILFVGPKLALYKGDGHGHFTDVTHETGLDTFSGHFLGCAVGDYDNDGYDDIYISGYRVSLLLHNNSGKNFQDITRKAGLAPQPWGTSAAWGDVERDGRLDLYVCNYLKFDPHKDQRFCRAGTNKGPLKACSPLLYPPIIGTLLHNSGDGKFQDITTICGAERVSGGALAAAFADFDGSGNQSLAVGNDQRKGDLLERKGDILVNVAAHAGVQSFEQVERATMGMDWGDYDNDGHLDLIESGFANQRKALYHNEGSGILSEAPRDLGLDTAVAHYLSFSVKWLDYNNDGWLDALFAQGHIQNNIADEDSEQTFRQTLCLLRNDGGTHFTNMAGQAGPGLLPSIVGRGLAIGDYDNDGRVDALVVDAEGPPLLLHNESRAAGHWLSFRLIGTRSNRDGYGATVTVKAGGLTQTRLCHADGSYLSSSDKRVHVGLGKAVVADTVTVKWPSGHADTYRHVKADRILTAREGATALTAFR